MKKKNTALEKTKNLALSSLMAAACFVLMYVGSVSGVFDLCAVVACAMIVIFAVIEIGGIFPWLIWLVSSTLCIFMVPDKFVALEFALFGGIYPMIKASLEKYPPFISWSLKFAFFNVVFTGAYYIATYVFSIYNLGFTIGVAAYVLANIFFFIADVAFTLMISIYMTKLRPRLKFKNK